MEMEGEGGRLNVPLLIVEAGPRPREGQIANHLKHTASKTLETRTHTVPRIPELGEREQAYVRSAEANWLKMSTEVLYTRFRVRENMYSEATNMSKSMRITLKDENNKHYHWTIKHEPRSCCCMLGSGHYVSGWVYTDHDGCERFSEGNWLNLVSHFKTTASNYGFELISALN